MLSTCATINRKIRLCELASGTAELYVFCPLARSQVILDDCVSCEFYRGLAHDREGCSLRCRIPDTLFSPAPGLAGVA